MKILVDMNLSPEGWKVLEHAGWSAQQNRVCTLLQTAVTALETGALLVIDERRARLRRLPIAKGEAPEGGAANGG